MENEKGIKPIAFCGLEFKIERLVDALGIEVESVDVYYFFTR